MDPPPDTSEVEQLVGQSLRSVEKKGYTWFFEFADDIAIATESPWRFMNAEAIVVTSEDHGHPFGLPTPVDAAERVLSGAAEQTVIAASIGRATGDLSIEFGHRLRLQLLQMSCAYESWRLHIRGSETICTGGGAIVYFPRPDA